MNAVPVTRPFLHGSISGYVNHRCRCHRCRNAWAEYIRNRARANGRKPRHGGGYYPDKSETSITFRPTALGLRLYEAARARTGQAPDDIFERLLRLGAAGLRFDETTGMLVAR